MVAYVTCRRLPLATAREPGSLRPPRALASGSGGVKALRVAFAGVALLGMAACSRGGLGGGDDQMTWAKAALERNGRLEVVATDPQTNTFTVRVKDTGELRMIKADQVVAEPAGLSPASGPAPTQMSAPSERPAPEQIAPDSSGVNAPTATTSTNTPGEQSTMEPPAAENVSSVPRTGFKPQPAPAAEVPNPNSDVASVTPGGRTLESGPGYAIKVASQEASPSSRRAATRERSATTSAAVERRHEPIICQGDRLLQIDNRNLEFDGDAVSAQDGCEIHITNSHITARGVGIS
ncbi:MAG TPA: hypothetical protein VI653_00005, partial [Steroidobacteraceae bacterium]